jgi:hypothetical protein
LGQADTEPLVDPTDEFEDYIRLSYIFSVEFHFMNRRRKSTSIKMANYPRDPEWYMESQPDYAIPLEFNPSPVSFIEIWNYPVRPLELFQIVF